MAKCEQTCPFCQVANGGECVSPREQPLTVKALWSKWSETPLGGDKPSFEEIGRSIGALVARKNAEYGDATNATAQMLAVLYPDGVPVDGYRDLLLVTRVLDKLCRITRGNQGEENAWVDVGGYGILGASRR